MVIRAAARWAVVLKVRAVGAAVLPRMGRRGVKKDMVVRIGSGDLW